MTSEERGPSGAVAYRQCVNPECLAEEGDRHEADCTRREVAVEAARVVVPGGICGCGNRFDADDNLCMLSACQEET